MSTTPIRVLVESTPKRVFVSALDWPGLSRGGKTEEAAVEALMAAFPRYAPVAAGAGFPLEAAGLELDVVERADGDAGTAFGVPSIIAAADREPVDGGRPPGSRPSSRRPGRSSIGSRAARPRSSGRVRVAAAATARRSWGTSSTRRAGTCR